MTPLPACVCAPPDADVAQGASDEEPARQPANAVACASHEQPFVDKSFRLDDLEMVIVPIQLGQPATTGA